MSEPQKSPKLITLILLIGLSVLSTNMFLPSLAPIAEEFDVTITTASLSLGVYLAVTAVLQVVMGPLSDLVGRRPVILAGLGIFAVASVGCLFAQNFTIFLAFRILQAAIAGSMILSRAIVRDTTEGSETARVLGVIETSMALAPLLGPLMGGLLDQTFGWRSNFVAYTLMGGVLLAICVKDLSETNLTPSASFAAQFKTYPTLLKSGAFWAWTLCLATGMGGFYLFISGVPGVATHFNLSPAMTGMGIGIISGGFMLGNFVTARNKGSSMRLIVAGRISAVTGPCLAILAIWIVGPSPLFLFGGAILVGFGNGLTLPGANAGVMSVNPKLAGSAAGLSGALMVTAGAIATPLSAYMSTGEGGMLRILLLIVATNLVGLITVIFLALTEQTGSAHR